MPDPDAVQRRLTDRLDRVGLGLCLVSAAGFGSLAVFGKQAYAGGLGVAGVLAIRFLVAAPLLVGLALAARRSLRVGWPVAWRLLGLGGIGYAIQATLFFNALTRISAGLASLPGEPYEAAHIDGTTTLQAFWHITLPLLRPAIAVAVLFRAIDALKTFDIIYIITQGGPANASETINILLFNQAFSYFNMGYASSMAVALFAVVMGASLIQIKVRRTAAW